MVIQIYFRIWLLGCSSHLVGYTRGYINGLGRITFWSTNLTLENHHLSWENSQLLLIHSYLVDVPMKKCDVTIVGCRRQLCCQEMAEDLCAAHLADEDCMPWPLGNGRGTVFGAENGFIVNFIVIYSFK